MPDYNWTRIPSGGWWLWDKPQGEPRSPVGSVDRDYRNGGYTGLASVGSVTVRDIHAGSIAACKARLVAALIEAEGKD